MNVHRRQALERLRRLLMGGIGAMLPFGQPSRKEEVLRTPLPSGDSIFAPAEGSLYQPKEGEEPKEKPTNRVSITQERCGKGVVRLYPHR